MRFFRRNKSQSKNKNCSNVTADDDDYLQPLNTPSACGGSTIWINDINELDIMADHLFRSVINAEWAPEHSEWPTRHEDICVIVRSPHVATEVVRPDCAAEDASIVKLTRKCEAQAAMTMRNELTMKFLQRIPPMSNVVKLLDGRKIDVFESFGNSVTLKRPQKSGFCLIRDVDSAFVWSNNAKLLIAEGRKCEQALSTMLWTTSLTDTRSWAFQGSVITDEKEPDTVIEVQEIELDEEFPDIEQQRRNQRETRLVWPIIVAMTFMLMGLAMGKLLSELVLALVRDGTIYQGLFLLYVPLSCFLSAFFLSIIIVGVFQLVGPISQMGGNSRTYSGSRLNTLLTRSELPHITIQCPVYKEGLWDVINPTVETVREAISTYENQGGTASIIMNDDGMRLISPEEQSARKAFYASQNIGWIARPPHNVDGFVRAGAFKKASNLNFGLEASLAIEKRYETLAETRGQGAETYQLAVEKTAEESKGLIWAAGDVGLGEFILLIDADTRLPKDCFLDAVKEFHDTPDLAILQHPSGVLKVANDFWENGLAHFTSNNYFGTRYVVASGDSTPFFGHNAFLRFSAVQDVAEVGADGHKKWWSEDHVSEDFELSLKLMSSGYTSRMAGYSQNEFQEGVCLTVYDELNRWEKYAFGISELMFNPVSQWFTKSPFTPLFRHFISSNMDLSAKCSSLFYMATYYGIGLTWILCVVNYILVGWYPLFIRAYYVDSMQILISISVIFGLKDAIVGPFVRYRLNEVNLLRGFVDSLKYFVITTLFLQGISMHVSKCLIWHLCDMKMSWGATNKSVDEKARLKDDLPMIWARFKVVYITVGFLFSVIIVLACAVPYSWRITDLKAILPITWMLFWHAMIPLLMHNRSFLAEVYRTRTLGNAAV